MAWAMVLISSIAGDGGTPFLAILNIQASRASGTNILCFGIWKIDSPMVMLANINMSNIVRK